MTNKEKFCYLLLPKGPIGEESPNPTLLILCDCKVVPDCCFLAIDIRNNHRSIFVNLVWNTDQ